MARNELVVTVNTEPFVEFLGIVNRHLSACIADLRTHMAEWGDDDELPPVRDLPETAENEA